MKEFNPEDLHICTDMPSIHKALDKMHEDKKIDLEGEPGEMEDNTIDVSELPKVTKETKQTTVISRE